MREEDYAMTFACFGSVDTTKICVDSLVRAGTPLSRVVVVDNGSTDGTVEYLRSLPLGGCIVNKSNLSCGAAWNQGILHFQSEWTVVMNNDILVPPGWVEELIAIANTHGLSIISPAMVEGEADYDFESFAEKSGATMRDVFRHGTQSAVCLCIHRRVFEEIGYFRAHPKLLGFEDAIFFHDLAQTSLRRAITGRVWIHHFGSITQKAMKKAMGKREREELMHVNKRRLLQQSWMERKLSRFRAQRQAHGWKTEELARYGMTLHGERVGGAWVWR
ncbi:glycosyltransferase-like protein [Candidatus Symbiobacter mobilis CR]|uniref:Glycosyltransferase-like protein n=2 Tax=Candidatus Symbiobacter TaxID=1436289 RepID=U5NBY3_9BURK|nr:glycosyltransferase-like protein [Candidatus Symbiobacter mobilis CR]